MYLVFSSLEMQRRVIQIKVYYQLFYSVWKEMCYKPWKVATAKKPFLSVYIMDTTSFDECFLFRVITGRYSFLYKLIVTQRFGVTAKLLRSLKQVFWKKSVFYIHHLQFLHVFNKIFFLIAIFYSFSWWMFHIFLYKWNF